MITLSITVLDMIINNFNPYSCLLDNKHMSLISTLSSVYLDFLQEILIKYLTLTNPLKTILLR